MSEVVKFRSEYRQGLLDGARLKRAELIKKRDCLNERIKHMDVSVRLYEQMNTPEAIQADKEFWENARKNK